VPLLERPGVGRVAVAHQLEQARFAELLGRPLVQVLPPRDDHRVVEDPAEALLVGDVALHVERERIAVRQHAAQREEDACHPEPRVAEQAAERSEPSQRQARRRAERVRVEHAHEHDVDEEALGCALRSGELPVLEVAGDDARVVRPVPVAPGRSLSELQPQPHGPRRRLAVQPAEQRDRLASVAQQPLVDRPPPDAAGRRRVERIQQTAARLPAHERQRRAPERQMARCAARRPAEHPRHQRDTRRRIVAHGRDLRLGERACVPAHREMILRRAAPARSARTTASPATASIAPGSPTAPAHVPT
jgi:hypothetical protein